MKTFSAFADEISSELDEQIAALKENGVENIEFRGVWKKNVLTLSEDEIRKVKRAADSNGLGFSAIGSPIGKFPLDGDFNEELERVKRALDYAAIIGAPYVRMFSYFIPGDDDPGSHRSQVIDRIGQLLAEAEKTDIVLAHENEKGIYGDSADRCLDLYETFDTPSFTGIFDFSNYVQYGHHPYEECWTKLKQYISYFHVKDSRLSDQKVVPAGEGDGDVEQIFADAFADGFSGYLTLEPHLKPDEGYGSTRPELFKSAADALKRVLESLGVNTV